MGLKYLTCEFWGVFAKNSFGVGEVVEGVGVKRRDFGVGWRRAKENATLAGTRREGAEARRGRWGPGAGLGGRFSVFSVWGGDLARVS